MIVEAAESLIAPSGSLGWGSLPASQFNNDPMAVREAIYNEEAWVICCWFMRWTTMRQKKESEGKEQ